MIRKIDNYSPGAVDWGIFVMSQIDNYSPGAVTRRKLVYNSHKRCELRHTIIRLFSRGNQRIREVIPVPSGLGKETTVICFYTSRGYLKCHGMLISATSSLGTMSSLSILALPFSPLYYMSRLSFLLEVFTFKLLKGASHATLLSGVIPSYKPSCTILYHF